jgi:hypothetical protein
MGTALGTQPQRSCKVSLLSFSLVRLSRSWPRRFREARGSGGAWREHAGTSVARNASGS